MGLWPLLALPSGRKTAKERRAKSKVVKQYTDLVRWLCLDVFACIGDVEGKGVE